MEGKTKLGSDATAAAGPSGVTRRNYVRCRRADLCQGVGTVSWTSLGGATLEPDNDANKATVRQGYVTQRNVSEFRAHGTRWRKVGFGAQRAKVAKRKS